MNLFDFNKSYEEMGQSNKMLLMAVLVLALVTCLQAFLLLTRHERIVMVPPYMDKRMEVAWNNANEEYYKAFAVQVATLVGNITPQNLSFVTQYIGLVMSADVYARVKPQLMAYGEDAAFKRGTVFSYFTPNRVIFEDKVNKFFVSGFLNTAPMAVSSVPGANRVESKPVIYEMGFKMYNGRPLIVSFDSYEGNKPHTQEWLKQNERREKAMAENEKGAVAK